MTVQALWACLLVCTGATAQVRVQGTVVDTTGRPLQAISVSLLKRSNQAGVYFTKTDPSGNYSMEVPQEVPGGFLIKVTAIGYGKAEKNIEAGTTRYNFTLRANATTLQEVVVQNKGPVVTQRGDTINFRVADFAGKSDRMIGDVLQKIPGIEVDKNGRIKYNGRYINNFYIDGDDLLADKYNTATKNVPSDLVDKIQVLENNQPIKILTDIQSGGTAINITLKDKAKVKPITNIQAGAGIKDVYDASATSLFFKSAFKSISVLKGNNTGIDLSEQVASLNLSDFLLQYEDNSRNTFISESAGSVPDINKQRYLFNNSQLLNLNYLFKLNNDAQVRLNGYALLDKQRRNYRQTTDFFLPGDTISFDEAQTYTDRSREVNPDITLTLNKSRYYLNNTTSIRLEKHEGTGIARINKQPIEQNLDRDQQAFSNTLRMLYAIRKKKIIEINSYIHYNRQPEQLTIRPGMYGELFGTESEYPALRHRITPPVFFTHNYLSFRQRLGTTVLTAKAGFLLQHQTFRTSFEQDRHNGFQAVTDPAFINNLRWKKSKIYLEPQWRYVRGNSEINLTVPLSSVHIQVADTTHAYNTNVQRFFAEPSLRWQYKIGRESTVYTSYAYHNRLGTVDEVYRGNILQNYRSFNNNDAPVQQSSNHNIGAGFIYRKAIRIFFANISGTYTKGSRNTIFETEIQNNITRRIARPYNNNYESVLMAGAISKYIFPLRSTVSLKYNYQYNKTNQLQNAVLFPVLENIHVVKGGFRFARLSFLTFNYEGTWLGSYTRQQSGLYANQRVQTLKQLGELDFFTGEHLSVKYSAEFTNTNRAYNNRSRFFFSDVTLRYRFFKPRLELEATLFNITNLRYYNLLSVSENSVFSSSYELRPRFALLKASFAL